MTGPSSTDNRKNNSSVGRLSRVLVIGASGLVGSCLLEAMREKGLQATGTYCSVPRDHLVQLDYVDMDALDVLMDQIGPEVVFCPAARPNVDWCESHPGESYRTNVIGIQNVAAACAKHGAVMVHFSSDYVFDGKDGPYTEEDAPHPINVYGRHKLASEEAVRSLLPSGHIIVRTTVVYGWEAQGKNHVIRLVKNLREGSACRAPGDQVGSPTYAPNLSEAVIELAERRLFGTWNLVGPEQMNRYQFACLAARIFGLDASRVESVKTSQLQQTAQRPLQAGMVIEKATAALCTRLVPPAEGLRRMRDVEGAEMRGRSE